jgi:hypothetical protein
VNGKFVPNATGELVRECGPDGAIVEHRVRKSAYIHERLHSAKKLDHELYDAAEKFRMDFEKAQLSGNYARLDLHKTRAGKQDMSDRVTEVVESRIEAVRCEQLKHAIGLYRWFERLMSVVREFLPRL